MQQFTWWLEGVKSDSSKSNSNFIGSFGVCVPEYRLGDLRGGQGDLKIFPLGGGRCHLLETRCLWRIVKGGV